MSNWLEEPPHSYYRTNRSILLKIALQVDSLFCFCFRFHTLFKQHIVTYCCAHTCTNCISINLNKSPSLFGEIIYDIALILEFHFITIFITYPFFVIISKSDRSSIVFTMIESYINKKVVRFFTLILCINSNTQDNK